LVKYRLYGLDYLLADSSKVRKSKIITPEIHQGLEAKVNSSDAPFLGYWDAQQWVNDQGKRTLFSSKKIKKTLIL